MNSDWKITFDEGFKEDLIDLGHTAQVRIQKYIQRLQLECTHPEERGESYSGNLKGIWKYRVGSYRIAAQIVDKEVVLLHLLMASDRKDSYSDKYIQQLLKRAEDLQPQSG